MQYGTLLYGVIFFIGGWIIEKYLLSLSNKSLPRICFIPTATGDNDSYIVRFYSTFLKLNCIPSHIDFFKRISSCTCMASFGG